ncbi:MAG: UvrD-helicase domain-containing protein [Wolbachia endosymbiont of Menacanthus eurysternus]|nr:MAG: UvrD-helicase domain-containing protein [Wolbachia endosymbiont of Menacanthus eurysternus]
MRLKAINPSFSVWVSASAGTGKTKILIDRVLKLLLENKKNILCLTFTDAAAKEIEDRIYNTLKKWMTCSENILITDLRELDFSLGSSPNISSSDTHGLSFQSRKNEIKARKLFFNLESLGLTVQTIHSFCHKLISKFPIEAGISPNYSLSECKELHSIVFDKMLHNKIIQDDINFIAARIDENRLRDLLYILYTKRLFLTDDLEYIKNRLNVSNKISNLENEIVIYVKKLAEILSKGGKRDQDYSAMLTNLCNLLNIQVCESESQNDSDVSYLDEIDVNTKNIMEFFLKSRLNEKKNISSIITKGTLKRFKDSVRIIENIQNKALSYIRNINSYQIFRRTSSLLKIFKIYINLYNDEKSKKALLDYDDIIRLAKNLINNSEYKNWISESDQEINHILIDEAQDNSIDQWEIITSLCDKFFTDNKDKRTLFVVGDIKQSIYRFQGANPHLFNRMQRYLYTKIGSRDWILCQLEKSFRSAPHILAFVDKLFNNFRKEITFTNNEIKHIPHRKNDQGYLEIWPPIPRYKEKKLQALQIHLVKEENYITTAEQLLSQAIARKIFNWLSEGRILSSKNRHIEPRDIMILVRQRNMLVNCIVNEFKKANISIIGQNYHRIMDYIVVQDLVALAEFLLLPTNDFALANVLKSPLFNFTDDDLFNIAYNREKHSLWERLEKYNNAVFNELNDLINLSHINSFVSLFAQVLHTGKKKFATRLGLECFEILDEFMNLVLQFENLSLQAFIQWIKENNPEIKIDMQSRGDNAIRIMTVHKSKGLQAPIVFLVDTNTVPKNTGGSIIFDTMMAPFWYEKNDNAYCKKIKKDAKLEDYNEYLRLLYVALTRAEDELYILSKDPVQKGSWYDLIIKYGEPYKKKKVDLYPIFKKEIEVLCTNMNYLYVYKKRDCSLSDSIILSSQNSEFNTPLNQCLVFGSNEKRNIDFNATEERITSNSNYYERGRIIHDILRYMPKIERNRRKSWIKGYLDDLNTKEDKREIYNKISAFSERYDYLFSLKGRSEIILSGVINGKSILVQLDRLCITKNKVIIIDYKSHRSVSTSVLNEIKKQMLIYKALVKKIYPDKKVECIVIWIENLTLQFIF